ncbi:MAG: GreA/GreB family elongation factor [Tepidanaerobacteraceae bacterium]
MEAKYKLSKSTFKKLKEHLIEVRANRGKIIDDFFSEVTKERHEFESLMELYIYEVDRFIQNAEPVESQENTLPFVIMGSEVKVSDKSDSTFKFTVVAPFQSQRESHNIFDVSCLSPVGRALLLKKVGDTVEVEAPGGVFHYEIKSISFP